MGIKRVVDVDFWNDEKVMDTFSPEDKLFMLYLLTNPHTTQLGIYAINQKHMSFELGYTVDVINVLLERFENKYHMIKYSQKTKEIAIKNFLKHSIIKGGKPVEDCLKKEVTKVKDKSLFKFVCDGLSGCETLNETVKKILSFLIENEIDKDNDNERIVDESSTNRKITYKNEFETLWKLYPNKKGKENALKSYIKARKSGVTYETVEQGIIDYTKECEVKHREKQYIKHGSTWFNNQGWEDEYDLTPDSTENKPDKKDDYDWVDWGLTV